MVGRACESRGVTNLLFRAADGGLKEQQALCQFHCPLWRLETQREEEEEDEKEGVRLPKVVAIDVNEIESAARGRESGREKCMKRTSG